MLPLWAQWLTFAATVCAAVSAGVGVWLVYWRGKMRLRIELIAETREDGSLGLGIDAINAGRIAIPIEEVSLAWRVGDQKYSVRARNSKGHPGFPIVLPEWKALAISVDAETLKKLGVDQRFAVVAETEHGFRIERRCANLRELHARAKLTRKAPRD